MIRTDVPGVPFSEFNYLILLTCFLCIFHSGNSINKIILAQETMFKVFIFFNMVVAALWSFQKVPQ